MNLRLAARLLRVLIHLLWGLSVCALVFPWLGHERRMVRVARWSAQLLDIFRITVKLAPGNCTSAHGLWVANHVSWIDIFVINALFPSRFVAKSEVRRWPLVGALSAWAGTIFVTRENRRDLRDTMAKMVAALEAGERVVVFPEGTSCAQGAMQPFRANLFEAAIDAKVTVQPVGISYFNDDGNLQSTVEYIGTTSLIDSMVAILAGKPTVALLRMMPGLSPCSATRRDLAKRAFVAVHADQPRCPLS